MIPFTNFLELVRHELISALRTRRIVIVTVLYLGVAGAVGYASVRAIAAAEDAIVGRASDGLGVSEEMAREAMDSGRDEVLGQVLAELDIDATQISPALKSSGLAAGFFLLSLWLLPVLINIATFDTLCSDLSTRSLCYSTLRVPRVAILLSRFSAQLLLLTAVNAACALLVLGVGVRMLDGLAAADALKAGTRAIVTLLPYTAAYAALATAVSSMVRRPVAALAGSFALLIALAILSTLGQRYVGDWAQYVSPGSHRAGLWHVPDLRLAGSVAAYLAFAAFGVGVAHVRLARRDL